MKFPDAIFRSLAVAALLACGGDARAQTAIDPALQLKIDKAASEALANSGAPSASIAIVRDGKIAYVKAYGDARLDPKTPSRPEMRYAIGSISKQFAAAAILLLAEDGKLSLDDRVSKFLPNLTRAKDVKVRQLLSHTAGYQDYWPQDYVFPLMLTPTTAEKILDGWARKPLDFEPGTKWQYSNTGYVAAGAIIEKVSGMPFMAFMQKRIFKPLRMASVESIDHPAREGSGPQGYLQYALGPLRPAPKSGDGWLFAMGELAMTAEDLAKWDVSVIQKRLLKPASYGDFEREVLTKNGVGTHYGLGIAVSIEGSRRKLEHGGEVSGFTAENAIYPDDQTAIVVLCNQDATSAPGDIARKISPLLFDTQDAATPKKLEQARKIFEGLQKGSIDRALFTDNCNSYFSETALKDFAASLRPLGAPTSFTQIAQRLRGGMTLRRYRVVFPAKKLIAWTYELPDGKLEQFQVASEE